VKLTKVIGDDNPALGFPASLNIFYGQEFAVNARGDVAFFGNSGSDHFVAVRKADGTDSLVAITNDRSGKTTGHRFQRRQSERYRYGVFHQRSVERGPAADRAA